jgi:hypothetical protein
MINDSAAQTFRGPETVVEGEPMMRCFKLSSQYLVMIVALAATASAVRADDPKGEAKGENKLVGTWKLVSATYDGRQFKGAEGTTTVKHITPTQFMWVTYDEDGKVTRAAGGGYTLKGETYEETPKYGISSDFDLIKGKAQTFKWKVEGNKWHHDGKLSNGLTIEEVWERVEKE